MTFSWRSLRRGVTGLALVPAGESRALNFVRGADEHVTRVRLVVLHQVGFIVSIAFVGWALSAWTRLNSAVLDEDLIGEPLVLRPTSGSNILAAYALLSALLFALQVSVRSLNQDDDPTVQIDASEAGRRRTVSFLSFVAGVAAFGLSLLCIIWFLRLDQEVDLLRVLGPVGASIVLAVVSAETLVAAELPANAALRQAIHRRALSETDRAREKLPGSDASYVGLRSVGLVSAAAALSLGGWLLASGESAPHLILLNAFMALAASGLYFFATPPAIVAVVLGQLLDSVFLILTPLLFSSVCGFMGWSAAMETDPAPTWLMAYRNALAEICLFFGPPALVLLVSLRGLRNGLPGIVVVLAARKIDRIHKKLRALTEEKKSERSSLSVIALWCCWVPVLPILLARFDQARKSAVQGCRRRRLAVVLGWSFLVAYVVISSTAALIWTIATRTG